MVDLLPSYARAVFFSWSGTGVAVLLAIELRDRIRHRSRPLHTAARCLLGGAVLTFGFSTTERYLAIPSEESVRVLNETTLRQHLAEELRRSRSEADARWSKGQLPVILPLAAAGPSFRS